MPAVIDSAPDCITHASGTEAARVEDSADFILQANYEDCAGIMTFGPGTVYGEAGANGAYYALTWIGIAFILFVLVAWTLYENRRLLTYAAARVRGKPGEAADAAQKAKLR
jgi:hypothetical protein